MLDFIYDLNGLNKAIFIYVNSATNFSSIPAVLQILTNLFNIANFAALYITVCIYFYFKINNCNNKEQYFEDVYFKLVQIGICYALFGFIFSALKFSVNLPRPFCSLSADDFITIADISKERCLSSFPSAHTGLSILIAYFIWPYANLFMKFVACLTVLLIATSRITLAMHYPADLIYSTFVTLIVIVIGKLIYRSLKKAVIAPLKDCIFRLLFSKGKI